MKILNVRAARSIWLFDPRDLNPRGLSPVPLFAKIKDRYRFLTYPQKPEEMSWTAASPHGIKFADGEFSIENQPHTVSVTFFNDGIIADTGSSTRSSDAFLEDLISFTAQHFGAQYKPEIIHKKIYVSELIARAERDLVTLCDKLRMLGMKLDELSKDTASAPYHWFGFEFRQFPLVGGVVPTFKVERELLKPPELQRYFSIAPLPTEAHIELLNYFEELTAR